MSDTVSDYYSSDGSKYSDRSYTSRSSRSSRRSVSSRQSSRSRSRSLSSRSSRTRSYSGSSYGSSRSSSVASVKSDKKEVKTKTKSPPAKAEAKKVETPKDKKNKKDAKVARTATPDSVLTLSSDDSDVELLRNRPRRNIQAEMAMQEAIHKAQLDERTARQALYNQETKEWKQHEANEFDERRDLLLAMENKANLVNIKTNTYSTWSPTNKKRTSPRSNKPKNGKSDDDEKLDSEALTVDEEDEEYEADFDEDEERKESVCGSPSNGRSPKMDGGVERRDDGWDSDSTSATASPKNKKRSNEERKGDDDDSEEEDEPKTVKRTHAQCERTKPEQTTSTRCWRVVEQVHAECSRTTTQRVSVSTHKAVFYKSVQCQSEWTETITKTHVPDIRPQLKETSIDEESARKKIEKEQQAAWKFLIDINKITNQEAKARAAIEEEALSLNLKFQADLTKKIAKQATTEAVTDLEKEEKEARKEIMKVRRLAYLDILLKICQEQEEVHRPAVEQLEVTKWKVLKGKELPERRHARAREQQRKEDDLQKELKNEKRAAKRKERELLREKRRKMMEFQPAKPTEYQIKEREEQQRIALLEEKARKARKKAYRDDWLKRIDKHCGVYDKVKQEEMEEIELIREEKMEAKRKVKQRKDQMKRDKKMADLAKRRHKMEMQLLEFEAEQAAKKEQEDKQRKQLQDQFEQRREARLAEEKRKAMRRKRKVLGLGPSSSSATQNQDYTSASDIDGGYSSYMESAGGGGGGSRAGGSPKSKKRGTSKKHQSRNDKNSSSYTYYSSSDGRTETHGDRDNVEYSPTKNKSKTKEKKKQKPPSTQHSDHDTYADEFSDDFEEYSSSGDETDNITAEQASATTSGGGGVSQWLLDSQHAATKKKNKSKREKIVTPTKKHHLPSLAKPSEPTNMNKSYQRNQYKTSTVPSLPAI
eukprot:TRINITY_DN46149_c0_g1_i1.p1 TRINITY_DN46149_c0_g1~~TRINITY_DN46149_c0_g1_i1.p1  ORF type:complete len:948 (+),score=132.99 TRINITY_DN46149_c0_g1_i1:44-2845(+)